jgi:fatty acid desaturase (delta-4 desaturase)
MPSSNTDYLTENTATVKSLSDTKSTAVIDEYTIQVDENIYDARKLASTHPGGELFVNSFSGRDATEAFLSYHRREFPHAKMSDALVGKTTAAKQQDADKEYLELCKIVEAVLPRNKSYAPLSYYLKAIFILTTAVGLEIYIHYTASYHWYLTGLLGFFFALIGLNIQHDANHGAISRNPLVNRAFGMAQNWIGGSAVDWIHQHVVQHHVKCNNVDHDPDIVGNAILRLNPLKPLLKIHLFQHVYIFVLLAVFGFTYIVDSLQHVIKSFHFTHMSKLLQKNKNFEIATILFFISRWIVLPLLQKPSLFTFLNVAPLFVVGGYYLAFFFVISHNFEGVLMFDEKTLQSNNNIENNFLRLQVATSSNVGGSFLCFLNGGLNYQIEHHLFPRVQHSHYPLIAPLVRDFCLKKNIPYRHFDTVFDNVQSCVKHLKQLGANDFPSSYLHSK